MLICRISARRSVSICGRPPNDRDFQRQYVNADRKLTPIGVVGTPSGP
jgi:hypothetical protein